MPTDSTANLEALIREEANRQRAAATAFETNMGNAVAEWAQHQAATRIALEHRLADAKDEADIAHAHAQDLQKQLDAAMARIRELEGEPEPQPPQKPKLATPELLAVQLNDRGGIWFNWKPVAGARNYVLWLQTKSAEHDLYIVVPVTEANRSDGTCGWDVELPADKDYSHWEFWGRIQAQDETPTVQDETDSDWTPQTDAFRVQMPVASKPIEPPPPPVEQPPGQSHVPPIPANAVYATSVAHAVKLRDESRRSGQPFVVRGLTIDSAQLPDRQLSLDGCKGPVWILDNDWRGDSKGFAAHQSPLFWDNERGIYIAGNTFRDMPKTCAIFAYGPQDCVIEGNRFENVHQPIHLILRESADAKLTIAGNVGLGISRIAVEIQSSGFGYGAGQRVYETRGVRLIGNDMACTVGGEMAYSLACPSARDMLVKGNRAWLPVKGSAQDANPSHGGLGYGFEIMAGRYEDNTVIGATHAGYVLEGDMAPWGATIAASNTYSGPGSRIGYQNRGERNPKHVIE